MRQVVDGPFASVSGIGQVFPYIFGPNQGVPAIPLRTGAQAALAAPVTATDTVFVLDDAAALQRFPDAGKGDIQGERFTWLARDFSRNALTGISRHMDGTTANPDGYAAATAVFEVIPEHVYGFFENPGLFQHRAITTIYLNGIVKAPDVPPKHVVTVADLAAVYDPTTGAPLSVGTVRFDMSTPIPLDSPFASPTSAAQLQHWLDVRQMTYAQWQNAIGWAALGIGGSLSGSTTPADPMREGRPLGYNYFRAAPPPSVFPQLGVVTGDLLGLMDDDAGSVTGTPHRDLTNPAHVVALLLREAFQQDPASLDAASFAQAVLDTAAAGYHWELRFEPTPFGTFQSLVFQQSRLTVFQEGGLWHVTFRRRGRPGMTLERARRVSWSMRWTPLQDVASSLSVTHGVGTEQRTLMVTSAAASAIVPAQSASLTLPWVPDAGMARSLARWQLSLRDHQRRELTLVHHSEALALLRTDTVGVEAPLLDPYGGALLLWKVNAVRVRPDGFLEIALGEEDPAESTISEIMGGVAHVRARRARARAGLRRDHARLAQPAGRRAFSSGLIPKTLVLSGALVGTGLAAGDLTAPGGGGGGGTTGAPELVTMGGE
jgi:hypothetical protein